VAVLSLTKRYKFLEKRLQRVIRRSLFVLEEKAEPEVFLVTDIFMKRINREFRKKNKPTNVLSFSFGASLSRFPKSRVIKWPEIKNLPQSLGQIYLAPDYIKRKKQDLGKLAIHGLLHLLGYTHAKRRDRIEMEKLEEKLITLNS